MTDKVRAASEFIGIQLYDHIIVGRDFWFSFAKEGKLAVALPEISDYNDNRQMRDCACKDAKDIRYQELAEGVRHFKEEKGYDSILKTAYEENPLPDETPKQCGRKKKSKALNLICKLDKYKESVCLFTKDLNVPFDNNQAERDIRLVKVKGKVSGCFRNESGVNEYLTIMSCVATAKNHGINMLQLSEKH